MASKGLSLPQTRGTFQMKGIVLGTLKDTFYKEIKTKTNKDMRIVNFGVQVAKDSVLYVTFNGMEQDYVYFSGKPKDAKQGQKNETAKVEWKNRHTFRKEGYRLIGINCGLTKTSDDKGREMNDKHYLHPFDAAEFVAQNLKDGQSVFVKGTIEYGHFQRNEQEVARTVKFIPNQISLCQEVVFDSVDEKGNPTYEVIANFAQDLVFQEIKKNEEKENLFDLSATIVNYNSVESGEFVVEDQKLALNFKKMVKPYTFIKVWGNLRTVRNTETVEVPSEDGWGNTNPMQRLNAPYRVERLITGADPHSADKETYSEKAITEALEAMQAEESKEKAFESAGDEWGSSKGKPEDSDDIPW